MSKRHRFAEAAIGVVVGAGIALMFLVWAVPGFRDPTHSKPDPGKVEKHQVEDISRLVSAIRDFDPLEDTYAQWAMTALSALATGFSIYAVFIVRDTLTATRRSVKEAERAANAAFASVRVTEETAQWQLRAYVTAENFSYHEYKGDDGKIRGVGIVLHWRNTGQTPAWSCTVGLSPVFQNVQPDLNIATHDMGRPSDLNFGVLGAGARMNTVQVQLTLTTLELIRTGAVEIYMLSRCIYIDAFKVSRWTEHCATVEVLKPATEIMEGGVENYLAFRIISERNGAT